MVQLSFAETNIIDGVVRSVRDDVYRQTLAAKHRIAVEEEKRERFARKATLHQQRFDQIITHACKGYLNLVTALRNSKLQELFANISHLRLYKMSDDGTEVVVTVRKSFLCLSVIGPRVSSTQGVGSLARYTECSVERRYAIESDTVPEAFFRHIFVEDFDYEWFDWTFADDGYTDETAPILKGIDGRKLQNFFRFNSSNLGKKTDIMEKELNQAVADGYDVDRAWLEMNVSPGHVLLRFFYDCVDVAVLQQHLSYALSLLKKR